MSNDGMIILVIAVLSFAPGIFLLWYFYKKDKLEPEPKLYIIFTFLLGMVAVIPAVILELPFSPDDSVFTRLLPIPKLDLGLPNPDLFLIIFVAPIVEEIIKFLTVRYTIYRSGEFDEPMDGIVYAASVALGFASLENVFYVLQAYYNDTIVMVYIVRALLAVPGHAIWSSMWGYQLGRGKFMADQGKARVRVAGGLLLAIVFHGLHNFLAVYSIVIGINALIALAVVIWWLVSVNIKTALVESPFNPEQQATVEGGEGQDQAPPPPESGPSA